MSILKRFFRQKTAAAMPAAPAAETPPAEPQRTAFLATMSHELKTPINAIVGYAELLLSPQVEGGPARARADYAQSILTGARELQSLVDDLLDAMRMQNQALVLSEQVQDFGELAEVAVRAMKDRAEQAGVSLVARLAQGIDVKGDPMRLGQVIRNLLSNAIKFSPEGGIVNIEMHKAPEGRLMLSIRDGGIGIASSDMARVFEPFVQGESGTARRFGGVGIGLPLARHIAELHGGTVTLSSEPGAGTEARLIIPAARVIWPKAQPLEQAKVA